MKIMAIDYGDARTGFAISDRSEFLASPIGTVPVSYTHLTLPTNSKV